MSSKPYEYDWKGYTQYTDLDQSDKFDQSTPKLIAGFDRKKE